MTTMLREEVNRVIQGLPENIKESTYEPNTREASLSSGIRLLNVHNEKQCHFEHCALHNPSDHEYRHLPLWYSGNSFYRLDASLPNKIIIDPDDYDYNRKDRVIFSNSAHCNNCGDDIESLQDESFQRCSCKGIAVNGGRSCLKRVIGNEGSNYVDISIIFSKK